MTKILLMLLLMTSAFIRAADTNTIAIPDQVTVGWFRTLPDSMDEFKKAYVYGLGDGLLSATGYLMYKRTKPIFCPPTRLSLNSEIYLKILNEAIKSREASMGAEKLNQREVSFVLLVGLQDTFPCKK
jgi:hypothetical protein